MNEIQRRENIMNKIPRWAQALIVLIALGIGVLVWAAQPDSVPAEVLEPTDETTVPADVLEPAQGATTTTTTTTTEAAVEGKCAACLAACLVSPDACAACESEHHCAVPPTTTTEPPVGYSGSNPGPFPPPSQTVKFIENTLIPNLDDLGALTDPNPDNPDFKAVLAWLSHAKKMLSDARGDDWTAVRASAIAMTEVWIPARPSQSQWQEYRQKVFCNLGGVLVNIGDKGTKSDT